MLSTQKGIFAILIGALTSLIGTIFQFILMYLLISSYGSQFNGFVKNTIAIVAFLGSVEGALGSLTVIFLLKPLLQKDYIRANEILNTTKHQYRIAGIIGIFLLLGISLAYSSYTYIFEKDFLVTVNGVSEKYALWKMMIIVVLIGSKNLIGLFWTACYENLMQADQNNHIRRLVMMICDLVAYSIIFYAISVTIDPLFIFLIFLMYSLMKGVLVYLFVKLNYPWIRIMKQKDNMQLVKKSNIIVFKNIGETLIINLDAIIVAILLGLNISSSLSLYMTIAVGVRSIMLILINSFREFFAAWTVKNGRINWDTYIKFETYAFMIGAFLFINQFILSPYFVTALYAPQIGGDFSGWTAQEIAIFNDIFYYPTFSLLIAISSVFIILGEPANVLIYAKGNYQKVAMPIFYLGIANVVISVIVAIVSRFAFNDYKSALYGILIITCIVTFIRFVYLWIYNWMYLTYNSNFKGVLRNWMILLIPIIIAILVNYLFINVSYNPNNIYDDKFNYQWGWNILLSIFFGLIVSSIMLILLNSILWAPRSVKGIILRLPIIHRIWMKKQEKARKIRKSKFEDDFINLTEPTDPYQEMWEREEVLVKSHITNLEIDVGPSGEEEIYVLKG
ncbi:hypothetical protein [Spiroplasma chrysopicola]|uniref:Transporter n=1 Tax=Spiroplasma chrysopicola DF-1 TaxID=1276227 RepID=R4U405_9MOLU|nr:hypothetical protein [Spiroplasma chrysopicola]AGM25278.1 hypothetical protein SCHRY_v1c07020 [Spiroplasma chrysopicola DF-1]